MSSSHTIEMFHDAENIYHPMITQLLLSKYKKYAILLHFQNYGRKINLKYNTLIVEERRRAKVAGS